MKAKKYWIVIIFLSACIIGVCLGRTEKQTLTGINTVHVRFIKSKDIKDIPITKTLMTQLQTDVELKLRKVGLNVQDTSSSSLDIYLTPLSVVGKESGFAYGYACGVYVGLYEFVTISRNNKTTFAYTWHRNFIFFSPPDKFEFHTMTRSTVSDLVDTFINDYLAANPLTKDKKPKAEQSNN